MDTFIYFIIAMVALVIIVKIFSWPLKLLIKLLLNGLLGVILLTLLNYFGQDFGIFIGINAVTALIAGFFGVPGVIFLVVFKLFF
ncbi:pro-sigmaK processing inhibitor BofA family protein [Alloiococcus sp. CFN-8]|uniref:pro-sigmaK processing inhibitor BofA family protein n=1 Tax=Alloiococcus sp. CFN-8 TaxID=3416081 RepID=UPI003CF81362